MLFGFVARWVLLLLRAALLWRVPQPRAAVYTGRRSAWVCEPASSTQLPCVLCSAVTSSSGSNMLSVVQQQRLQQLMHTSYALCVVRLPAQPCRLRSLALQRRVLTVRATVRAVYASNQ